MSVLPDAVALAIICQPGGDLVEVIYDELGVKPDRNFLALIHSTSQRKARRFLRTAVASHGALDWELVIALTHGVCTLFFSASMTNRGIMVMGMKEALRAGTRVGALPDTAVSMAGSSPEAMAMSLRQLNSRRRAKAQVRKRLRNELKKFAGTSSATSGSEKPPSTAANRGQMHFLKMLAHDLRNPISGILAASQYLIEDASTALDNQQMTLLRSIESSSGLMLRLIEDLLEVSSGEAKRPQLHFRPADLSDLVEQCAASNQALAGAHNIQIGFAKRGAIPLLDLDSAKMMQAINALLTKTIGSARPGSSVAVDLQLRSRRAVLAIRVKSGDGAGETPTPGLRSKKNSSSSNALTLLMARSIVKAHGGTLRVQNAARQPSYTISLPSPRS